MDRRLLAGVGVLAVALAVGLAWLMRPDVGSPDPAPVVQAGTKAKAAGTRAAPSAVVARPQATTPTAAKRAPGAAAIGTPAVAGRPAPLVTAPAEVEPNPEYRCRALGQQADLIDKLIVICRGGAVDDEQRKVMAGRVAKMATRVFEEGESMWAGELDCGGISDVNLGPAADFMADMQDELDLDDTTRTEIEQALGVLDTVDWPEYGGE